MPTAPVLTASDLSPADLAACLGSRSWQDAVLAGAPHPDAASLLAAADAAARALPDAEVLAALHAHPRIGERPAGEGAGEAFSRSEQPGVDPGASTAARLAAGNAAYEARFGHVFLVRAAGRSAEEVLAALEQRLGNDPAAEVAVAREQLREIALGRLASLLGEAPPWA